MDSRLGELETKRKEVIGQIKQLNEQLEKGKLFALINDRNLVAQLRQDKLFTAEYLKENYGVCRVNNLGRTSNLIKVSNQRCPLYLGL